jgi:hypothetical protein
MSYLSRVVLFAFICIISLLQFRISRVFYNIPFPISTTNYPMSGRFLKILLLKLEKLIQSENYISKLLDSFY